VLGSRDEGGRDGHCGWWWRLLGVDVAVSGQRPSSKQQAEAWVSPIGTRDTGLERAKSSCRRYRCAIQSRRRGSRNSLASGTAADGAEWINRGRMWVRVMRLDWGRTDRSRWQRGVDSERAKSFIETHNHHTNGGPLDCNHNAIHCPPLRTCQHLYILPMILPCSRDTRRAAIVDAVLGRPVPRVRSHVKLCIYRACGAPESPPFCLLVEVPPCLSRDSASMPSAMQPYRSVFLGL
jgi:hypothetical protein